MEKLLKAATPLITLFAKVEQASEVGKFSPIAFCSVLYASEVLANGLWVVLPDIINDAQPLPPADT